MSDNTDWRWFDGRYDKKFYDVKFANGVTYYGIWPNAGEFRIPAEQRSFNRDRVLTHKDKFMIRPSKLDSRGMAITDLEAARKALDASRDTIDTK